MEDENKYELFGQDTDFKSLDVFQTLYELGLKNKLGKLSNLQKEVLTGVSLGQSYAKLQNQLGKKHIASIQAPLAGGIKNMLDAIMDTVWLFNSPDIMDWLKENAPKRYNNQ